MSREVRRVPADWMHPVDGTYIDGRIRYRPLLRGEHYVRDMAAFQSDPSDFEGVAPRPDEYMPDWPSELRTHYQMYETTTEGTPISPVMPSCEELARWLADTRANAGGGEVASYEAWLHCCGVGFAPSGLASPVTGGLRNGVQAHYELHTSVSAECR